MPQSVVVDLLFEHEACHGDLLESLADVATAEVRIRPRWALVTLHFGNDRSEQTLTRRREHCASRDDIDMSKPVDLVMLAVKQRTARYRLLGSERVITLRAGSLHRVIARGP